MAAAIASVNTNPNLQKQLGLNMKSGTSIIPAGLSG